MEPGGNRIVIKKNGPAFSKDQKVGFGFVIGVGVLAFVMGVFYLGAHLTDAFDIDYDGPPVLTGQQKQQQALLELQQSDTDGDTISDYEELYLLRTSPYLADTDGDGLNDALEVTQGSDPNCAPGGACEEVESDAFGSSNPVIVPDFTDSGTESVNEAIDAFTQLTEGVNSTNVREVLIQQGVAEADLAQYTDEELLDAYLNTLTNLEESGELNQLTDQSQTQTQQ